MNKRAASKLLGYRVNYYILKDGSKTYCVKYAGLAGDIEKRVGRSKDGVKFSDAVKEYIKLEKRQNRIIRDNIDKIQQEYENTPILFFVKKFKLKIRLEEYQNIVKWLKSD